LPAGPTLNKTYSTVLFDLDGTLTDPRIGITKSVQYALAKMGIVENDLDSLTTFIGPPLWDSFRRYYSFDEDRSDAAVKYYREYFSETGIFENELYDGIVELLVELGRSRVTVRMATSKPAVYAVRIADHFDIAKYFASIEGSELDGRLSNKGELIRHILSKYRLERARTVMVGDREHDILGAKSNAIDSIGVGYGYGTREELEAAGSTRYAGSIKELAEILAGALQLGGDD
jgi:phosphoglycolate phosphatase